MVKFSQDANGNLDMDPNGSTLTVDQTNDRVGIGTMTPSTLLEVAGTATVSTLTDGTLSITGGTITSSTLASPIITGVIALNSNSTTVPPLTLTANSLNDGVGALRIDSVEPDIYLNDTNGGFTTVTFANAGTASAAFGRNSSDDFYITVTADGGSNWRNDTFVVDHDTGNITVGYKFNVGTGDLRINGTDITASATELNQLTGVTLGTAASSNTGDFATAAQGATADTALQTVAVDGITITGDGAGIPLSAVGGGGGTPGGNPGEIQFNSAGSFGGDSNLFWDDTNDRLGVGTNAPSHTLHVRNLTAVATVPLARFQSDEGNVLFNRYGGIMIQNNEPSGSEPVENNRWQIQQRDGDNTDPPDGPFDISYGDGSGGFVAASATIIRATSGGNVGIGLGNTDPSTRLHVNGTVRQTNSTSAVLVSDANGDIGSASNLQDVAYLQTVATDGTTITGDGAGTPLSATTDFLYLNPGPAQTGVTSMDLGAKTSWNPLDKFVVASLGGLTAPTYNAPLGQITINAAGTYEIVLSIVFRNTGAGWSSTAIGTNYTRLWVTRGPTTELGPVRQAWSSSDTNTLVRIVDLQVGDIVTPVIYWNITGFTTMTGYEISGTSVNYQNYCYIRRIA